MMLALATAVLGVYFTAVAGALRYVEYVLKSEDPDCVADRRPETDRLTEIVLAVLPAEGRSQVDADSGCERPREEPSIAVHVDGTTTGELTAAFRTRGWTPVSAARLAEEKGDEDRLAGLGTVADGRRLDVFLAEYDHDPGSVLVIAWFPED
ncbi:hypothetical protein FDA94_25030 [Herbidospora galbida]|uniref:Uncharacterized protein n=1 Tax=Herbidospora galbida TaxID=2575442 RepID=A0A4U3MD20_9ACTN|nr:hypothetical protein [Herbidospora galbida]TKK85657.1 hypothetical protein FDA94_25030 [Herbidospora galbida]